ncbi:MAG: two-component system sensor histidine kinase FlrB [Candidatus Endobugula sp.]|jgi:two-component system sensor histidine kinase FlrB
MAESIRHTESSTTIFPNVFLSTPVSDALVGAYTDTPLQKKEISSGIAEKCGEESRKKNSEKNIDDTSISHKSSVDLFSDLSAQLTESYSLLEHRVADLTSELNTVSEQRIQELKDKEQVANRLEHLINFLPGGVVVLDHRGIIVEINPAAGDMLQKDLRGQLWRDVIQQCFSPKSDDGHEVSNTQGQRINISTRSLGQDGQIILLTDQSETRHLQAELSRHERLTALGKMVSTLAHQVRTPLSSAMLYGSHLLNETLSEQKRYEFTQKMVNRLHEMERQVRDMLLFVKAGMPLDDQLSVGELHALLFESTEMIFSHHSINCCWNVDKTCTKIMCNKDALIGAILNLVNNSVQAMGEGGELIINLIEKKPNHLIVSVIDNGSGIDEDVKSHVNDMFFTTKSQGTGIGLSVVNTVVKAHNNGTFNLISNSSGGVSATLELPIIFI